jgi:hypothetical protein
VHGLESGNWVFSDGQKGIADEGDKVSRTWNRLDYFLNIFALKIGKNGAFTQNTAASLCKKLI